jgi:quercetin dioxygenase-like cupin family protein
MITFNAPKMAIKTVTPEQMKKRVARYKSLTCPPDRYPDSQLPGHVRKNYLIVGRGLVVDDGKDPLSAIPIDEGFQMSYVEAEPGNGPMLHNHDTNETFVAIRGRWRVIWGRDEEHHVDLDTLDVCSVPPFVPRRFINLEHAANGEVGLLLTVQPGNAPNVEFLNKD